MKTNEPTEQGRNPSNAMPETDDTQCSPRQLARRRILQAAAGAPVVFTLPTGTALANSSSACVGDRAGENPTQVTLMSDKWVRFETPKLEIKLSSNKWVYGFKYNDKYFQVLSDGTAAEVIPAPKGNGQLHVKIPTDEGSYYVLVHHEGDQLVLSTQDETGAPLTGSCWASVGGAWIAE